MRPALTCAHEATRRVEQRVLLLRRGLTERVARVRAAATSMLRTWLVDECGANITALLRALDVEAYDGAQSARLPCGITSVQHAAP